MKFRPVKATGGTLPQDNVTRFGSLLLAIVFVLMLVGQLFAYEDFPAVLASYLLLDGTASGVLAACMVVLELAALPALLFMSLSPLARMIGWLAGGLVLDIWLILTIWAMVHGYSVESGLFGTTIAMSAGWYALALLVTLEIVYITAFIRLYSADKNIS